MHPFLPVVFGSYDFASLHHNSIVCCFRLDLRFASSGIQVQLETQLLALLFLMPCFGSAKEQPNIVLVMTDEMGYERLGANGGADYKTPFLDSLVNGGICFEHAHSQPICTPSRVKTMTGTSNPATMSSSVFSILESPLSVTS
jgi:hypothetical protein